MPIDSLDPIIPTVQAAFSQATRGIVGFVGGANVNGDLAERVRVGQDIVWGEPVVGEPGDATPGSTGPREGSLGALAHTIKIERQRNVPIPVTGDQFKAMQGNIYPFLQEAFVKAIRKLIDEMDAYAGKKLLIGASTALTTPNPEPFLMGTEQNMMDFALLKKAIRINGYQPNGFHLVAGPVPMLNLEGQNPQLFRANEFGSDELSRWGKLTTIQGFSIGAVTEFPAIESGTANGYAVNGDHAAGVSEVAVKTGSGTFKAGTIVMFSPDYVNRYVVAEDLSGPGVLKLNSPLKKAVSSNALVALPNLPPSVVAYDKNALKILARPPAVPDGGDAAIDSMVFQDKVSKLVVEVALYKQYLQQVYDVRIAYGAKVSDSEAVVLLGKEVPGG